MKLLSLINAFFICFSFLNPTYAIPFIFGGKRIVYGTKGLKNCFMSFFLQAYGNPRNWKFEKMFI